MVVLINGAFGAGKTTAARLLRRSCPGSVVFDPEPVGVLLQRLSRLVRGKGGGTNDFQDLHLWRRSVVHGVRLWRRVARGPVLVPMAFSSRAHFDEVVGGIGRFEPDVRAFCLRASPETLVARLAGRGDRADPEKWAWAVRRSRECVEAHADPHFGYPVETERRTPQDVAAEVLAQLLA